MISSERCLTVAHHLHTASLIRKGKLPLAYKDKRFPPGLVLTVGSNTVNKRGKARIT